MHRLRQISHLILGRFLSWPFRLLFNLFPNSIRNRLIVGFGIMLVLVAIAGLVGGLGVLIIQKTLDDNLNAGYALNDLAQQAIIDMESAQRSEVLYRQNLGDLSLELSHSTYIDPIINDIQRFIGIMGVIGEYDLSAYDVDIEKLISDAEKYREYTLELVDLTEQRGLIPANMADDTRLRVMAATPDADNAIENGLMDEIQILFFRCIDYAEQLDDDELTNLILQVQIAQSVFVDTVEIKDYVAVKQAYEAFGEHLQTVAPDVYINDDLESVIETQSDNLSTFRTLQTEINRSQSSMLTLVGAMNSTLLQLERVAHEQVAEAQASIEEQVTYVLDVIMVSIGVAVVLGSVLAVSIQRSISRPLRRIMMAVQQIAGGDLNRRIKIYRNNEISALGRDVNTMADNLQTLIETEQYERYQLETTIAAYEQFVQQVAEGDLAIRLDVDEVVQQDDKLHSLGQNLNQMVGSLNEMASQIRSTASAVNFAVSEIQSATTQQAAFSIENEATVTETVVTLETIQNKVGETAGMAQSLADSAQQSLQVSNEGMETVNDVIDGMEQIRQQVDSIAETILILSERTQQIGEIIETVNALANQSKLLALNASIEAARAGDEGRGFAVVAMEVRQLAEQSQDATSRVSGILTDIQQATNTAVMVTEEGSKKTAVGMELVDQIGSVIINLSTTIEAAAQLSQEIASSTGEQSISIDQLLTAMTQIRESTSHATSSMRQTEQSALGLKDLSDEIEKASTQYVL